VRKPVSGRPSNVTAKRPSTVLIGLLLAGLWAPVARP
jgi:hypothetical protein